MFVSGTLRRPAYRLYQLAWAGLDWIYPPDCGGCSQPGVRWCASCQRAVQQITPPLCQLCGQPQAAAGVCPDCQSAQPPFAGLRSWAIYNGSLRQAVRRLKYAGDMALADILSRPLVELLYALAWPVEIIVPVPSGRARLRQRGYNQAALLAYPLALGSGIRYRSNALRKKRETLSQVGLGRDQRMENVAGAFVAIKSIVDGRSVLVVDDVTTTGATLNACVQALLEAGARCVYGLTLARAGQDSV